MTKKSSSRLFASWLMAGAFCVLISLASAGHATTYVITDTRDVVAMDLSCTLREALTAATEKVAVDTCPAGTASNTIELGFATYTFDQGAFFVPDSIDPIDLEITGLNGALVATRIDLANANGFLQVDGNDLGTEIPHHLQISGVQIQNGLTANGSVLSLSGSGSLTLERVTMIDGNCLSSCNLRASALLFAGTADLEIEDSLFVRNDGSVASLFLQPEGLSSVRIANSRFTDSSGGLQIRAEGLVTIELEDLEIDRAGTDAPASLVVFLDLSDTVSLTAHRVNVHDNIIQTGSPINIDLRNQATAVLREWTLQRNQGSGAGALDLLASDLTLATMEDLEVSGNTSSLGSSSARGAVFMNAAGGRIVWSGGTVHDNFTASSTSGSAAGLSLASGAGGRLEAERLEALGNRHVNPTDQANTTQAALTANGAGSSSQLRNSLFADSPGLGLRANASGLAAVDLANVTIAQNVAGFEFFAGSDPNATSRVENCVFFDDTSPTFSGSEISLTTNITTGDPLFADLAAGDYRLSPTSPAIDAGTVGGIDLGASDLANRPRVVSGTLPPGTPLVDIGAYEFQPGDGFADDFESGDLTRWSLQVP